MPVTFCHQLCTIQWKKWHSGKWEWLTCQTAPLESEMSITRLWDITIHVNVQASFNIWWIRKRCSRECPRERSRDWVWNGNQAGLRIPYSDDTTDTDLCQRGAFLKKALISMGFHESWCSMSQGSNPAHLYMRSGLLWATDPPARRWWYEYLI